MPEYLALVGQLVRLLKVEKVRENLLAGLTVEELLAPLRAGG